MKSIKLLLKSHVFPYIWGPHYMCPKMWDATWRGTLKVTLRCTLRRLGGGFGEVWDIFGWLDGEIDPPIMMLSNQQRQFLASNMYLCVVFFVLDECKIYHYIQHVDSVNINQVSRIAAIAISISQCYHIRIHMSMLR